MTILLLNCKAVNTFTVDSITQGVARPPPLRLLFNECIAGIPANAQLATDCPYSC
jgi:hypothetical protein